jgi:hypothetical protein
MRAWPAFERACAGVHPCVGDASSAATSAAWLHAEGFAHRRFEEEVRYLLRKDLARLGAIGKRELLAVG